MSVHVESMGCMGIGSACIGCIVRVWSGIHCDIHMSTCVLAEWDACEGEEWDTCEGEKWPWDTCEGEEWDLYIYM